MRREFHVRFSEGLGVRFPGATHLVVHCRSRHQLEWIKRRIERRLKHCKLDLHPEKTRVIYCKGSRRNGEWPSYSFDFLGYQFRSRSARNRRGEFFVSFSPAISPKAAKSLRQRVRREWKLKGRTQSSINEIARIFNPIITGWINCYGRFCRSALHPVLDHINDVLAKWAMRKFKRLRGRRTRAHRWLKGVARRDPQLFVHWQYQDWMTRAV
ncbi:MAG: group II intron maturase-specific domain-containing protein [Myxococcota bacterium]|nr:group II intron maturase-specific domain-containing protein [Myxococcota bacterium]